MKAAGTCSCRLRASSCVFADKALANPQWQKGDVHLDACERGHLQAARLRGRKYSESTA